MICFVSVCQTFTITKVFKLCGVIKSKKKKDLQQIFKMPRIFLINSFGIPEFLV